jgi:hypothetical protein
LVFKAMRESGGSFRTITLLETSVGALLTIAVVVVTMIWLRSEIVALRSAGVATKTSPGMAIGGWFIPFANFVLPLLAVREVFTLRLPRASSALPIVWWVSYIALMVTNNVRLPFPIGLLVMLACFGMWAAIVFQIGAAPAVPRLASNAPPWTPQPAMQPWPPPR